MNFFVDFHTIVMCAKSEGSKEHEVSLHEDECDEGTLEVGEEAYLYPTLDMTNQGFNEEPPPFIVQKRRYIHRGRIPKKIAHT